MEAADVLSRRSVDSPVLVSVDLELSIPQPSFCHDTDNSGTRVSSPHSLVIPSTAFVRCFLPSRCKFCCKCGVCFSQGLLPGGPRCAPAVFLTAIVTAGPECKGQHVAVSPDPHRNVPQTQRFIPDSCLDPSSPRRLQSGDSPPSPAGLLLQGRAPPLH